MAKQWAVAPFQIGDKLPDNYLSPKMGRSMPITTNGAVQRCCTTIGP